MYMYILVIKIVYIIINLTYNSLYKKMVYIKMERKKKMLERNVKKCPYMVLTIIFFI